jgi:hypothetical protein
MKNSFLILIACSVIAFSSCAPVRIYSDAGLKNSSGLKYYTVKPFLQVERDSERRIVKTVVLYLPDLANPQYLAVKNGPGASKVDLKLTDGAISTFGFSSDPQFDETVEALAELLSKGAGAIEDLNGLKGPLKATSTTVELYEIVITNDKTFLREISIGIQ